jgi:signal transduction histidine kinase
MNLKDSLDIRLLKLSKKTYDTLVRNELSSLSDEYRDSNKSERFLETSKTIEKKSLVIKDTFGIIKAKSNIGLYYYEKFIIDSSYYYVTEAEKLSKITRKKPFLGSILQIKANIHWSQKNYAEAESTAIQALKIFINKNYLSDIIYCNIIIANSLTGMKKENEALKYYYKALEKIDGLHESKLIEKAQIYNYIALLYQKQSQHQKAISTLENEINEKELRKLDVKLYCYQKNTKNYSRLKLGDKSSVNEFLETLKIGDSLKFAPIQITSKTYLGEYYLAQKDTATANFYLKDAQNQAHKNDIFEDELTILKLLGEANPQQNSYYSNRFIHLNDSLQIEERKTRDKFARIEFETDQIITEKEAVEKQNVLLNSRIWIIIGFSFLLLLILFLWFKNKSQKAKTRELILKQEQQKANEEIYQLMIDQQQKIEEGKNIEKQRISLDLHDSVMGKLTAVRMNLYVALLRNNLADDIDFSKQIDEIQEVEKEIRAIAHNLNSDLFSDNANFISVVQQLFNKIENHSQLQFNLHVSDALNWDLVSNNIKINLYRILQEALQNIEKYADAKNVAIIMTLSETNEIAIIISDDGTGFDSSKKSSGIGIKNMKLRMEELKGSFDIQSEIGKGTKINLTIPM